MKFCWANVWAAIQARIKFIPFFNSKAERVLIQPNSVELLIDKPDLTNDSTVFEKSSLESENIKSEPRAASVPEEYLRRLRQFSVTDLIKKTYQVRKSCRYRRYGEASYYVWLVIKEKIMEKPSLLANLNLVEMILQTVVAKVKSRYADYSETDPFKIFLSPAAEYYNFDPELLVEIRRRYPEMEFCWEVNNSFIDHQYRGYFPDPESMKKLGPKILLRLQLGFTANEKLQFNTEAAYKTFRYGDYRPKAWAFYHLHNLGYISLDIKGQHEVAAAIIADFCTFQGVYQDFPEEFWEWFKNRTIDCPARSLAFLYISGPEKTLRSPFFMANVQRDYLSQLELRPGEKEALSDPQLQQEFLKKENWLSWSHHPHYPFFVWMWLYQKIEVKTEELQEQLLCSVMDPVMIQKLKQAEHIKFSPLANLSYVGLLDKQAEDNFGLSALELIAIRRYLDLSDTLSCSSIFISVGLAKLWLKGVNADKQERSILWHLRRSSYDGYKKGPLALECFYLLKKMKTQLQLVFDNELMSFLERLSDPESYYLTNT